MKCISSELKLAAAVLVWTFALPALPILPAPAATPREEVKISSEGKACLACHKSMNPGLVAQWQGSAHAGVGVDCTPAIRPMRAARPLGREQRHRTRES